MVYFYYFHTSINNNITFDLLFAKKGNYSINLLINDKVMKKQTLNILSLKSNLDAIIWKNICNEIHICRLSFIITNINKDYSSLKINIKVENDKNDNNDNNESNALLIIILVIIILILIVGIIIIILKFRKKANNIYNFINGITEEKETELFDKGKD